MTSLSRSAAAIVLADSSVATHRVPQPGATNASNLENQLDTIVKSLPVGATWVKVYLPGPSTGRPLDADAVTDFVLAQAKLLGAVGAAPAGTVEILGQKLPADRTQPVVTALNLKPVYLITKLQIRPPIWRPRMRLLRTVFRSSSRHSKS